MCVSVFVFELDAVKNSFFHFRLTSLGRRCVCLFFTGSSISLFFCYLWSFFAKMKKEVNKRMHSRKTPTLAWLLWHERHSLAVRICTCISKLDKYFFFHRGIEREIFWQRKLGFESANKFRLSDQKAGKTYKLTLVMNIMRIDVASKKIASINHPWF